MNKKQEELGEVIRENCTMKDIVYDPTSGDFVQVEKGSIPKNGDIVTEMTEKGFAFNVGQMTPERFEAEKHILGRKLPRNAFLFKEDEGKPYLLMAAKTSCANLYGVRIDLESFPYSIPHVEILKMLKDKDGNELNTTSASMHVLSSRHGGTAICHYGDSDWTPMVSLYKIYIRVRIWLEMYELHLDTGNPIDYYLEHAS